jgi:hypothetical protein
MERFGSIKRENGDRKLKRMEILPRNPHIPIPIRMGYFLLNFVLFDFHSIDFLNPAIGFFQRYKIGTERARNIKAA